MGKITGFMEFERLEEGYKPVGERVKNYKEFVIGLDDAQAKIQGARCMDCGTPFCNSGCPVNNIIPDFNELVFQGDWKNAIEVLHSTNNFPEFTGRICPAPCEAACTLNVADDAVGIKSIEHAIIDRAWQEGWVKPRPAAHKTGKKVAVVGSGPAGMAAAQQLARVGHDVTLFEKNDRIGGLLRYGIPDFKMEKSHIDRRVEQLIAEGVTIKTSVMVGNLPADSKVTNWSQETISPEQLQKEFDAVLLTGGSEQSRDLNVPGRDLAGIHFAMEFLPQQNKVNAGDKLKDQLRADGKHVIVIGGGVIGLELGSVYQRLGAKVTVIEYAESLLPTMDVAMGKEMQRVLKKQGMDLQLSTKVEAVERSGNEVTVRAVNKKGEPVSWTGDYCLVSVGRRPYTDGLNLAAAGLATDERGRIAVNDHLQTAVPHIYAIGDVVRGAMLAHKAEEEGVAVAERIAGQHGHVDFNLMPWEIYTSPEIAWVGKTEQQLKADGVAFKAGTFPFLANGRARALGDTTGMVKMLADATTDEILGVHVVGPMASELIAEACVAMAFKASSEDIARICHAHPSLSESTKEAALAVDKRTLNF